MAKKKVKPFSVAAVIPAFNAEASLARAIESALAQTLVPDEIIVVDDGSSDNTKAEAEKFGDKVRYIRQENQGPGQARNTGIEAAKSEWVAFLDSDDEWLTDRLETQIDLVKRNPDLMWLGGNAVNNNDGEETFRSNPDKARAGLSGRDFFDHYLLAVGNRYIIEATNTFLIKKEVFDRVGLFDPTFLRAEDSDMWCRIAFTFPKFGYVNKPLARFHLDVRNPVLHERRTKAKDGKVFRRLIDKLMPMAKESGCEAEFDCYAAWILKESLLQTIFHGHKADARETVDRFGRLFPKYVTYGTYLATVFPTLTSMASKRLVFLYHLAKMEARTTRRWTDH
jgi:glycosyltransferase involved in cell wall biosynthesis